LTRIGPIGSPDRADRLAGGDCPVADHLQRRLCGLGQAGLDGWRGLIQRVREVRVVGELLGGRARRYQPLRVVVYQVEQRRPGRLISRVARQHLA